MNTAHKVVVVGGGIAGLCAAVYARRCGYEVEVLEQHSSAGGLATSWQRGDYTFETCLHWLLGSRPGGPLHARWAEVCDIDRLRFIDPPEYVRMESAQGESLAIYSQLERLEGELLRCAPEDAGEIRGFIAAIRRLAGMPLPDPAEAWPRHLLTLLEALPRLPLLSQLSHLSCGDYAQRFRHPLLRAFFGDGDLAQLSALALVFSLAWMSQGNAGYPIGGSRALIGSIVQRLRELGGVLRLDVRVEKILVDGDAAVGVRLADGQSLEADWVISAADGHATYFELLESRYNDDAIERQYRTLQPFPSYLQVSLGVGTGCDLSTQPPFLTRLLEQPLQLDPETRLSQLAIRCFNFDPSFAPPGKTAMTCFLPTGNFHYWTALREADYARYRAEKQRVAEAVITLLDDQRPGLRAAIEVIDVSTPASVIRYTGNWHGSMEGWLPKPGVSFAPLPGSPAGLQHFQAAGHWVMPGGGLPSGIITARRAVQTMCRQDELPFRGSGEARRRVN